LKAAVRTPGIAEHIAFGVGSRWRCQRLPRKGPVHGKAGDTDQE